MSDQGSSGRRGPRPAVAGGVQVGRILGVPVVIQPLWFVIVIVIAVSFGPEVQRQVPSLSSAGAYAVSLVFVLLLYGSVLVHEISHVAVAKALGMEVRRIVLQMLGGVSEVVEEHPGKPGREGLVAAVGPITSFILGLVGLAVERNLDQGTVAWVIAYEF